MLPDSTRKIFVDAIGEPIIIFLWLWGGWGQWCYFAWGVAPGYTYQALSGQNAKYQSPVDDFDEFLSAEGYEVF